MGTFRSYGSPTLWAQCAKQERSGVANVQLVFNWRRDLESLRTGGRYALSFRRVPRGVALKEADDTPQFPHQLQGPVIGMFEKARRHKAYEIAALALLARNLEAHRDGARG